MKSGSERYRSVIWFFLIALILYLLAYPLILQVFDFFAPKRNFTRIEGASYWDIFNQKLIETFFGILFFSFGASLGSFLNVVAYRMPLGKSVVFNPSKCPRCDYSIAMKDNIPVLGWLLLKGECRNCQQKISSRYPIVEGICGAIFLLLFFCELITGGRNLPIREPNFYSGVVWIVLHTKWDLIAIYVYHCSMFAMLLSLSLFAVDRSRVPKSFVAISLLLLIVPPFLLNYLIQIPYDRISVNHQLMDFRRVALTLTCGGFAGLTMGLLSWFWSGGSSNVETTSESETPPGKDWSLLWGFVLLGIGVGWQALIGIGLILLILLLIRRAFLSSEFWEKIPSICWLLIAGLIHQMLWRLIYQVTWRYLE